MIISIHGRELIPDKILGQVKYGGINIHPCLWKYKGADPIKRLIADKSPIASVGAHRMTDKVDEGEVLVEHFIHLQPYQSEADVYNQLYPLYPIVLIEALRKVEA